jgi:hypothetical protein
MTSVRPNRISKIPIVVPRETPLDSPYTPPPLPRGSHSFYICGGPGQGKTTTILGLLLSKPTKRFPERPRYYNGFFDSVDFISPSMETLPLKKMGLPDEQLHSDFTDGVLQGIIERNHDGPNGHHLVVIDDAIHEIGTCPPSILKAVLNRRHCVHDSSQDGKGGLSLWITSQHYKMLAPRCRANMSHLILFPTRNRQQRDAIRTEVMHDLTDQECQDVFRLAWPDPHSFLFVDLTKDRAQRYFANFSLISF